MYGQLSMSKRHYSEPCPQAKWVITCDRTVLPKLSIKLPWWWWWRSEEVWCELKTSFYLSQQNIWQ